MNSNKYFLLIVILCFFISCNHTDDLNGYWKEYDKGHPDFYNAFFLNDSSVSHKIYLSLRTQKLEKIGKNFSLPKNIYEWSDKYKVKNDEIIFSDSTVWKRSEETTQTKIEDLYSNLKIIVVPPIIKSEIFKDLTLIDSSNQITIINVGEIKNSFKKSTHYEYYSTIQLNDVIADITDIALFIDVSGIMRPYKGRCLIINADNSTPINLIDSIAKIGAKVYYRKNIFRTIIDTSNNDVVLKCKPIFQVNENN